MNLSEAMAAAADTLYDSDMAAALVYNGAAVSGFILHNPAEKNSAARILSGRVMVRKSDVAAPAYRDKITIAGVTWRVVPPVPLDETEFDWTLKVEADPRPIPKGL